MNIRPIKNESDHQRAMAELMACLEKEPAAGTDDADYADVLATLIGAYEDEHYPAEPPSPIEAIRFRMDQLNLAQKDLVPYIGSPSKVSEVLNGKRSLSITMIRNLHRELGVPAEVLIAESSSRAQVTSQYDELPLKEMHKRGYFTGAPTSFRAFKKQPDRWIGSFFRGTGVREFAPAYARSSAHYRSNKTIDEHSFIAWQAKVIHEARERPGVVYRQGVVDASFLEKVAELSIKADGPLVAREFIEAHGIRVVIEKHLPKTYLDGAALLCEDGPIVALTLRHDRLDNFWFTLLHELAHVGWHLDQQHNAFFDVLDAPAETDTVEEEGDRVAADALIAHDVWADADVRQAPRAGAAISFAQQIGRHPAIVAERIRRDHQNYRLLTQLVGSGQVRALFETQARGNQG